MKRNNLYPYMDKGNALNLNQLKSSGYYGYNKDIIGVANSPIENGIIVVWNTAEISGVSALGGNGILQLAFDIATRRVLIRANWLNSWGQWKEL